MVWNSVYRYRNDEVSPPSINSIQGNTGLKNHFPLVCINLIEEIRAGKLDLRIIEIFKSRIWAVGSEGLVA